jgi:hypothetical protein
VWQSKVREIAKANGRTAGYTMSISARLPITFCNPVEYGHVILFNVAASPPLQDSTTCEEKVQSNASATNASLKRHFTDRCQLPTGYSVCSRNSFAFLLL